MTVTSLIIWGYFDYNIRRHCHILMIYAVEKSVSKPHWKICRTESARSKVRIDRRVQNVVLLRVYVKVEVEEVKHRQKEEVERRKNMEGSSLNIISDSCPFGEKSQSSEDSKTR